MGVNKLLNVTVPQNRSLKEWFRYGIELSQVLEEHNTVINLTTSCLLCGEKGDLLEDLLCYECNIKHMASN